MEALLKKQLFWTRLTALLLIVILLVTLIAFVLGVRFVQNMDGMLQNIDAISQNLAEAANQLSGVDWKTVGDNLQNVSASLSSVDWVMLTGNISDMSLKAQESLQVAQNAVEALDIDTLNSAIADLQAVIEPLANFVNRFRS